MLIKIVNQFRKSDSTNASFDVKPFDENFAKRFFQLKLRGDFLTLQRKIPAKTSAVMQTGSGKHVRLKLPI